MSTKNNKKLAAQLAADLREDADFENRVDTIAAHMKKLRLTKDDFSMIADSLDYLNNEENPDTPLPPSDDEEN